ncbi:hypothetical protein EYF80_066608 [Liparis tanakae]|uniref:Uncharacterized protein n=1 Tax=Liparis tanakae TaxID=230148 RepID=A0A4Z2E3H9_9TELE|nr:hypothetical protein EYF80_066608 [Liparis tanakae]
MPSHNGAEPSDLNAALGARGPRPAIKITGTKATRQPHKAAGSGALDLSGALSWTVVTGAAQQIYEAL